MRRSSNRFAFVVVVGLLLVAVGMALVPNETSASAAVSASGYSTEVSIEASQKRQGAFLCKALVRDLGTGEVVAGPAVLAPAGEEATAETAAASGAEKFTFTVQVDGSASSASYAVKLASGGQLTVLHKGTLKLVTTAP